MLVSSTRRKIAPSNTSAKSFAVEAGAAEHAPLYDRAERREQVADEFGVHGWLRCFRASAAEQTAHFAMKAMNFACAKECASRFASARLSNRTRLTERRAAHSSRGPAQRDE
jgi:hypothetical protein